MINLNIGENKVGSSLVTNLIETKKTLFSHLFFPIVFYFPLFAFTR